MDDETTFQILQFKVQERLFCIELNTVLRVINFTELQEIPGTPKYFKGLLNLQGQEVPVIDVADRLNFASQSLYNLNTPIILCIKDNKSIGLIVDEVLGIETLPEKKLQMSELLQQSVGKFLQGTLTTQQGDTLLLNMDNMFIINDFSSEK